MDDLADLSVIRVIEKIEAGYVKKVIGLSKLHRSEATVAPLR